MSTLVSLEYYSLYKSYDFHTVMVNPDISTEIYEYIETFIYQLLFLYPSIRNIDIRILE